MQDIISSILDAEKKAEELLDNAYATAKAKRLEGESVAEAIRADAIDAFKLRRTEEIVKAEKNAAEEYDKVVQKGAVDSRGIIEKAQANLGKAADYIVIGVTK